MLLHHLNCHSVCVFFLVDFVHVCSRVRVTMPSAIESDSVAFASGKMSSVRRTFSLFVTFDLGLSFILWVIYTQVSFCCCFLFLFFLAKHIIVGLLISLKQDHILFCLMGLVRYTYSVRWSMLLGNWFL